MAKVISDRFFLRAIIISLSALIAFHGMVLTGIVPFEIVWGEKIKNASQMYKLETISIIVNVLMLLICSIKAGNIKAAVNEKVINFLLWVMFVFFCLNTVGNLLSGSLTEKLIFTPVTILVAFFTYRVATSKRLKSQNTYQRS